MKYDINELLAKACNEEYLTDINMERVWKKILIKKRNKPKEKKRVLLPVAVCAAVAVTIVMAIPTVRAEVINFFENIGAYMSAPKEERPQVQGVVVQEEVPVSTPQLELNENIPTTKNAEWTKDVSFVGINEAMYDGEKLYLNYTVDGSKVDLVEFSLKDDSAMANLYNSLTFKEGDIIKQPTISNSIISLSDGTEITGYNVSSTNEDGLITMVVEFAKVNGINSDDALTLKICLADTLFTDKGLGGDIKHLSKLEVPFTIDTAAANNMKANTEIQEFMLLGKKLYVEKVFVKPTEILLDVFLTDQKQFDVAFKFYLDGKEVDGKYFEWAQDTSLNGEIGEYSADISIPFPPENAKELKIVPCSPNYADGKASKELEGEQPIIIQLP